jgi:hypothetical protein
VDGEALGNSQKIPTVTVATDSQIKLIYNLWRFIFCELPYVHAEDSDLVKTTELKVFANDENYLMALAA